MATTKLDLSLVDTLRLSSIAFADLSQYVGTITNPSFEITAPGFNKINVQFTPRVVNIYNMEHLGIECDGVEVPLPDGIYTVKYSINPNASTFVEKKFMRTAKIECKYEQIFLAIDTRCECNPTAMTKLKRQLRSVEILIQGAIAAANQCDIVSSEDKYKKANNLLENIKICQCN